MHVIVFTKAGVASSGEHKLPFIAAFAESSRCEEMARSLMKFFYLYFKRRSVH